MQLEGRNVHEQGARGRRPLLPAPALQVQGDSTDAVAHGAVERGHLFRSDHSARAQAVADLESLQRGDGGGVEDVPGGRLRVEVAPESKAGAQGADGRAARARAQLEARGKDRNIRLRRGQPGVAPKSLAQRRVLRMGRPNGRERRLGAALRRVLENGQDLERPGTQAPEDGDPARVDSPVREVRRVNGKGRGEPDLACRRGVPFFASAGRLQYARSASGEEDGLVAGGIEAFVSDVAERVHQPPAGRREGRAGSPEGLIPARRVEGLDRRPDRSTTGGGAQRLRRAAGVEPGAYGGGTVRVQAGGAGIRELGEGGGGGKGDGRHPQGGEDG